VDARHNKYGSIFPEDRTKPFPRLIEQALTAEDPAELLWPCVAGDPMGQPLKARSISTR
jgi:hypothetical protein